MSEYSQTYGSFERTGNYPLEADLIFNSYQELEEWASEHQEILHEGLFKIVIEDSGQRLYWAVKEGDQIVFKLYSGGSSELEQDVVATNVTVGNITNGTKVNAGTTFTEFVMKMLVKPTRPTYSLSGIASTTPIEVGTAVTNAIGTYVPNQGGNISNVVATITSGFVDSTAPTVSRSGNTITIAFTGRIKEGNNTVSSTVNYQASTLFPEITAGSVTATRTIVGSRKYFRGNGTAPTSNTGIRNATSSLASSTITYNLNAGSTDLWIAIPSTRKLSEVRDAGALNAVITSNFNKVNTILVDGATVGKDQIDYDIYQMSGYGPFGSSHNLTFTIS